MRKLDEKCHCGGEYDYSRHCAVHVCDSCDDHHGLVRCYCGWSASGGDGARELIEMGEYVGEDY